jgi:V-type H+-transporting ATPase subunit D
MKGRLKGAETGHNLLKKKADALTIRFRSILKKIIDVRRIKKKEKEFCVFL